jgi:hypothetical protein
MTRTERRQLQAYLHFRDRPMSVLALVRFNWRIFALVVAMGLASVAVTLAAGVPFMAWILGVAYGTIALRDIGQCLRSSRTWSMTRELLDWPKVERLALENGLGV